MLIVPSLIGAPLAFFPFPRPHTAFFALAVPAPNLAEFEVAATPAATTAEPIKTTGSANAKAALRSVIPPPPFSFGPLGIPRHRLRDIDRLSISLHRRRLRKL